MSKDNQKIKNKKAQGSLGRGLESLLGASASGFNSLEGGPDKANNPVNNGVLSISVEWIRPNKNQPRDIFNDEALDELSKSIKSQGILQPIVVRTCGQRSFEIIAGERRWRAAQKAGLSKVPVIIKEASDNVSAELALIENIQREDLNPMEEAEALQNLLNSGSFTQQVLADRLGKNRSSLANLLRLLNLDTDVRKLLKANKLSLGQAKLLLSLEDFSLQKSFANIAIKKDLSVQDLSKLIKKQKLKNKAKSFAHTDKTEKQIQLKKVQDQIEKKLGTKVQLDYANGKGHLNIHFSTDKQLNQIVQSLVGLK
ncbi:MAG: ParB/RepB/Spo0J family partition protein [Bdellovibrionales bacterium]|nr:ParB/RepB/Spo0J family partition protein [Bdellovibrionales bacterium]